MNQNIRLQVAMIDFGNIGADLMIKVMRSSKPLSMDAMAGINPQPDGPTRAAHPSLPITNKGIEALAIDLIKQRTEDA